MLSFQEMRCKSYEQFLELHGLSEEDYGEDCDQDMTSMEWDFEGLSEEDIDHMDFHPKDNG